MAAEVKIPTLTTQEYVTLTTALQFYKNNEEFVAKDKNTDIRLRNQARTAAVLAAALLEKIK